MTTTDTEVTVTQADREAAASLWINVDGDLPTPAILNEAERYRQGVYDHTPAVQAFARHRTLTPAQAAGPVLLDALKRIADERSFETDASINPVTHQEIAKFLSREIRYIRDFALAAITQEGPQA